MEQIILDLLAKYPISVAVLAVGGTLVVVATAYVAFTPSKSDDAFVEKIKSYPVVGFLISLLERHSLVKRNELKIPGKKSDGL